MPGWRLIALDMDGTLLQTDGTISAENRKWIARAREHGIEVTLATGRMFGDAVRSAIELLDLKCPVVVANGGEVRSVDGQLFERHELTVEDMAFLHQLAVSARVHFWACSVEDVFHPVDFPSRIEDYTWIKFGFQADSATAIRHLWNTLRDKGCYELTNSDPLNLEVNPLGITKASGLATVCKALGIEPHQVIAMGDSLNDVPMLRYVGLGVAMGNAQDAVKQVARYVTAHHTQHGVARVIEKVLRGEL